MYLVLIPIGSDENQVDKQVRTLVDLPVDASDVELVLTHVLHDDSFDAPKDMQSPGRVTTVKQARDEFEKRGFATDVRECDTPPEDGIIALAEKLDVDHIVIGARKRSPAGKALFGSVTQSVILNTEKPVTVAGTTHR